jgi:hypothetical protein
MFRFKYAGRNEDESLGLASRVMREMGPAIEDHLTRNVGWAKVERTRMGGALRIKVNPRKGTMNEDQAVREGIGQAILENLMSVALHDPSAPIITASGNLAAGGRMSGSKIGL